MDALISIMETLIVIGTILESLWIHNVNSSALESDCQVQRCQQAKNNLEL